MSENVFAVVGPGAVGGLFAWLLSRAGHEVVAVGRPETVAAIRDEGIALRSATFGVGVERVAAATEVPEGASVILATKAYGLADVLPVIAAGRPSEVVSFLNGVEHREMLREALPGGGGGGASPALRSRCRRCECRGPSSTIAALSRLLRLRKTPEASHR
ncbi:oxidoreductase [Leifsonia xyli subsp. xyli str. CTCB07]|uniref:Oxidoreductase n=1 Tax=Leifsonia xyli subsp. xyli (strain CTCB07) TaxID=281090 RepID=Q6AEP8_LEIXX|nr:2-dehydropantoate 2-reductase [Leifsonia xyli]AAT89148.1 oxidoreductase [Leifsonia xyli subsp. xyli str. CTCB07]